MAQNAFADVFTHTTPQPVIVQNDIVNDSDSDSDIVNDGIAIEILSMQNNKIQRGHANAKQRMGELNAKQAVLAERQAALDAEKAALKKEVEQIDADLEELANSDGISELVKRFVAKIRETNPNFGNYLSDTPVDESHKELKIVGRLPYDDNITLLLSESGKVYAQILIDNVVPLAIVKTKFNVPEKLKVGTGLPRPDYSRKISPQHVHFGNSSPHDDTINIDEKYIKEIATAKIKVHDHPNVTGYIDHIGRRLFVIDDEGHISMLSYDENKAMAEKVPYGYNMDPWTKWQHGIRSEAFRASKTASKNAAAAAPTRTTTAEDELLQEMKKNSTRTKGKYSTMFLAIPDTCYSGYQGYNLGFGFGASSQSSTTWWLTE